MPAFVASGMESANGLSGFDCVDLDAGIVELFFKVGGAADERRPGAEVDGKNPFDAKILDGKSRGFGPHGEVVANGEHAELGRVEVADELHVRKDGGIAGVVKDGAVVDGEDKAGGDAAVEELAVFHDAGGVAGFGLGDGDVGVTAGSADIHADGVFDALGLKVRGELKGANHGCAILFGHGYDVGNVVEVGMRGEDEVDFGWKLEVFWEFRVLLDEGVDEDVGALGGGDENRGVTKPGDRCAFEVCHQ